MDSSRSLEGVAGDWLHYSSLFPFTFRKWLKHNLGYLSEEYRVHTFSTRRQRRNGTVTTKWYDELEFTIYFVRFEVVVVS